MRLDRRIGPGEPVAVLVAPRAQRGDLQSRLAAQYPVDDADRALAVSHRHLDLELHRAEVVAPARHAVVEVEGGQVLVSARVDHAAAPLVGGEPDAPVADDHHDVERGETEHPRRSGRRGRRHQQPVVAAGAQARHGAATRSRRDRRSRATRGGRPRRACRRPRGRTRSAGRSFPGQPFPVRARTDPDGRSGRPRARSIRSGGWRPTRLRCRRGSTR